MKTPATVVEDITDFIKHMRKNPDFAGTNVYISPIPGKSYILAKSYTRPMPMAALPIDLDYFNVMHKSIIDQTIYKATYDKEMPPEEAEAKMVCRTDSIN